MNTKNFISDKYPEALSNIKTIHSLMEKKSQPQHVGSNNDSENGEQQEEINQNYASEDDNVYNGSCKVKYNSVQN